MSLRHIRTGVLTAALASAVLTAIAPGALAAAGPDLAKASAYLVAPANLVQGQYYQSFPGYADFGLTIEGAFALAAAGDQNPALMGIVTFLNSGGKDPHGNTVNTWTGIGTRYASGGSIGDEALLAEVTGYNPSSFGGHDLIAALNASVCARASSGRNTSCAAAGNYSYATSVFDQALGIIAQIRAGQAAQAAAPARYLESLRNPDGSFPSLIPDSHDQDVDSTAMAAMALALVPGATAAADVRSGLAWIASRQISGGGFPGSSGDSVNSAGLAIQALTLQTASYRAQIGAGLGFLAAQQNADGGFRADAGGGQQASNVRASTEAVSGTVGTPLGTLQRSLTGTPTPSPSPSPGSRTTPPKQARAPRPVATVTQTVTAAPAAGSPAAAVAAGPPHSATPAAPIAPPQPAVVMSPAERRAFTAAARGSALVTGLWWAVLGVGVAGAVAIGLLYLRRRRLYPTAGSGA